MKTLRGKKALITGAAGGIGQALAQQFAAAGADLFLVDRDADGLARVTADAQRLGGQAIGRICDVSQPNQISATVQSALAQFGTLDVLVNNAGVCYYGPTQNMSAEQWDRLLSVNLHAPIQFTRELLPTLSARPEAHILNVASAYGLIATGRCSAYHASKFAMVGFSEALRAEYASRGVGITALCPGFVDTNFFAQAECGHVGRSTPTPPAWLCSTPEQVAAKAARAITRNRGLVLVGPTAYAAWYVKRFAPQLIDLVNWIAAFQGRRRRGKQAAQLATSTAVSERHIAA